MPELPEVETIKNQLKTILPFQIKKVMKSPHLPTLLQTNWPSLTKATLISIDRYGKGLIFHFELKNRSTQSMYLFSQLGMSGGWRIGKEAPQEKHTHLTLVGDTYYLSYVDPRRFGRLSFWTKKELDSYINQKLGVDVSTSQLTINYILTTLHRYPKRTLKNLLLDQSLFAGVGNYLANEICAHAKILPTRLGGEIKKYEGVSLLKAFKRSLTNSIKSKGTTFQGGYRDASGQKGKGVDHLVVFYQKICQLCHTTPITKIYLDGRGTYYCSHCQQ